MNNDFTSTRIAADRAVIAWLYGSLDEIIDMCEAQKGAPNE